MTTDTTEIYQDDAEAQTEPRESILFSNDNEDIDMIVTFDTFSSFWRELEVWVRVLLIE